MAEYFLFLRSDEDCGLLRSPLCYGNVLVNPCPEGWELVATSRTCINIGVGGTQSWSSAKATCEGMGAWLVRAKQDPDA